MVETKIETPQFYVFADLLFPGNSRILFCFDKYFKTDVGCLVTTPTKTASGQFSSEPPKQISINVVLEMSISVAVLYRKITVSILYVYEIPGRRKDRLLFSKLIKAYQNLIIFKKSMRGPSPIKSPRRSNSTKRHKYYGSDIMPETLPA